MQYIDEKFKDATPENTVEKIKSILKSINIDVYEDWHESGIDNCHSLTLYAGKGFPSSNGKGVTKEFARASAYGEFIERLQSGLFFYKYQSLECDPEINLQCYAPDAKYFTKDELLQNADWFELLTESYKGLTKENLASQCEMYAHTEDGKILCIPFYSLFEGRYVYMPAGFIEHMYSANGCCVGNTKEEALLHALSEIMERKASTSAIRDGKSFPEIPESVLSTFPTVSKILTRLRENENLDVKIFDCSVGNGFPVVSTRIINKVSHGYHVNFAADPVLEIAIQRSLTETFQSRNIDTIALNEVKPILTNTSGLRTAVNVLNQLETGNGSFVVDYFAEELTCDRKATKFDDNSNMSNKQLLHKTLELYKQIGKPVLVRNYDFLGFPCYKVIVPGFSESRGMKLTEPIQEYAVADVVSKVLRYPEKAHVADISMVPMLNQMIMNVYSRKNNFTFLSGLPIDFSCSSLLFYVTTAYCAYRMNDMKTVLRNVEILASLSSLSTEDKSYFLCLRQYLRLRCDGVPEDKITVILNKFNKECFVKKLEENIGKGNLFDGYLLRCDNTNCDCCRYKDNCHYDYVRALIRNAGEVYSNFVDGQNAAHFAGFIDGSLQ